MLADSVEPTTNMRESPPEVGENMYSGKELKDPFIFNTGDKQLGNSSSDLPSLKIKSTDFRADVNSSQMTDINSRKRTETEESAMANGFKFGSKEDMGSTVPHKSTTETSGLFSKMRNSSPPSASEYSMNSSVSTSNGSDLIRPSDNRSSMEVKSHFSALEQTSVVNELNSDIERLQEEIKAQLVELEYGNAHLECNAADERAKLLASEVIGLEEKVLKLRSNELKLENSHAEISSCKKKMSSLERERQDLQMTIDALQEEKKLLQSKLRKASKSEKSIGINNKNVSTSTEVLGKDTFNQEIPENAAPIGTDASDFPLVPESGHFNLEVSTENLPPDQMRMIQNINQIISELAVEKEELIQALTAKSSESSRLKDLNKELSRKLETQTQRLELLTAQSMTNVKEPTRLTDAHTVMEETVYADEGDEKGFWDGS